MSPGYGMETSVTCQWGDLGHLGDLRLGGLGGPWGDLGALGDLWELGDLVRLVGLGRTWGHLGHGGWGLRPLGGHGVVGDLRVGQNCAMADLSQTLTFFWRSSGPGAPQKRP